MGKHEPGNSPCSMPPPGTYAAEAFQAQVIKFLFSFSPVSQGERVAELILHHARANQCQDIERFKAEMAELVTKVRSNTIALGKASAQIMSCPHL